MLNLKPQKQKEYPGLKHDRAFKPASLQKNLPFVNDKGTFGEDENKLKQIIEGNLNQKKMPAILPKKDPKDFKKAFVPASTGYAVFEKMFKPRTGVPFNGYDKPEFKKRQPLLKKPFTYNRLTDSSLFSPAITSIHRNMKSEFRAYIRK